MGISSDKRHGTDQEASASTPSFQNDTRTNQHVLQEELPPRLPSFNHFLAKRSAEDKQQQQANSNSNNTTSGIIESSQYTTAPWNTTSSVNVPQLQQSSAAAPCRTENSQYQYYNEDRMLAPASSGISNNSIRSSAYHQHANSLGGTATSGGPSRSPTDVISSPTTTPAVDSRSLRQRWTSEEHEAFLKGLDIYGRRWKKIQAIVKTKTAIQVRTHAYGYFAKLLRNMPEQFRSLDTSNLAQATSRRRNSASGSSDSVSQQLAQMNQAISGSSSSNQAPLSFDERRGLEILQKHVLKIPPGSNNTSRRN